MSLVKDYKYDVDINTSYRLSNTLEIHNSLIKAAIADSRDKAYFIAEAMDQKISGIDSIEIEKNYGNKMDWMCREQELDLPMADVFKYSNQLKSPVTNISASVEVVWLIE